VFYLSQESGQEEKPKTAQKIWIERRAIMSKWARAANRRGRKVGDFKMIEGVRCGGRDIPIKSGSMVALITREHEIRTAALSEGIRQSRREAAAIIARMLESEPAADNAVSDRGNGYARQAQERVKATPPKIDGNSWDLLSIQEALDQLSSDTATIPEMVAELKTDRTGRFEWPAALAMMRAGEVMRCNDGYFCRVRDGKLETTDKEGLRWGSVGDADSDHAWLESTFTVAS
jgi:hypothetical protein